MACLQRRDGIKAALNTHQPSTRRALDQGLIEPTRRTPDLLLCSLLLGQLRIHIGLKHGVHAHRSGQSGENAIV
jgi:hypothetical protein